ncbi:MAG: MerR family transcriptional regulator [Candidatus Omnitrophica bacterium]|nr:MerR family transcriptional regulator [Candidatus Omnitrophota bacterium]
MRNIYLLKDLAKISGYSTHALKFYLRLGLLKEIGRSPETKFRYFDDTSYERLKKIRDLQKQDFTLKEIRNVLNKESEQKVSCQ